MKKSRMIIPIILTCLAGVLFIIAIILMLNTNYFKLSNKTGNTEKEDSSIKGSSIDSENQVNTDNEIKEDTNNDANSSEVDNSKTDNNSNTEESSKIEATSESDIISYFSSFDNEITENSNQDDRTLREKVTNAFTTIVDFIFYDKEISGYTFNDLTTEAKLKIIKLALSIDNKIDEYFPDYKDVIKDNYTNIKGKLAVKYLEITSYLCDSVGVDTCNQAKEDFNNMKESFGFTWQLLKELASSGSSKVKDFYESFKDNK